MTRAILTGTLRRRLRLSPSARRIVTAALIVVAIEPALVFAGAYLSVGPGGTRPFDDAITYLAAGERLNAGHELYSLGVDDRPVRLIPGVSMAALLSPPPIAAIWRPIAVLPLGFQIWVAACWLGLLGTIAYLVWKVGLIAVGAALLLAEPIGQQLAVANVAALFPALLVLAWRFRWHPAVGALIGIMTAIKLAPAAMGGWLFAGRRWRALAWMIATVVVLGVVGAVGAGPESYATYLEVASDVGPSPMSLSAQSGYSWMSYAVLGAGTILAIALSRWPGLSFAVAIGAFVVGTPALWPASLVPLVAMVAPLGVGRTTRPGDAAWLRWPQT